MRDGIPKSRAALLLLAAAVALTACPHPRPVGPDFAVSAEQREALVKGIVDELRDKYVFPERLDAAVTELQRRWSDDDFRRLDHAHALVERINADLRDLFHDGHLSLG